MSTGSTRESLRRFVAAMRGGLLGAVPTGAGLPAFHDELDEAAAERMHGFAWLLGVVHVALLGRDLTLSPDGLAPNELSWAHWLFGLHVLVLFGSALTLLLLSRVTGVAARGRVAYAWMIFLLVWSALVSGADQLIGASVTLFLIVNLASALFVTFRPAATLKAFAIGAGAFVFAQLWFSPRSALGFSQLVNGSGFACVCALFSRMLYTSKARDFVQRATIARQHAELELAHRLVSEERARSERVLYAVLPPRIAERLRQGERPIADVHSELTVVFADLAGFTHLAAELPAASMVELLNELFSLFDHVMQEYQLEKIKTVGDAYLAVRGIETPTPADVPAAADAALALQRAVLSVARRHSRTLSLRVGVARGVAMAGVLGHERLLYDLWGDVVNTASRLETAAAPGEILIPDTLSPLLERSHELGPVKVRELKGKGQIAVRAIVARRSEAQASRELPRLSGAL